MPFRFRLQKVLEARKIDRDLAQKDFAEAQFQVQTEQLKLAQLEELEKKSYQDLAQAQSLRDDQVSTFQQIIQFQKGLKIKIQKQKKHIEGLQAVVEKKQEILRQKTIEYKIVEKLKEKKKFLYLQDANQKENKERDETTVLRYSRREDHQKEERSFEVRNVEAKDRDVE